MTDDSRPPADDEGPPEIADAAGLFDAPSNDPVGGATPSVPTESAGDGYALIEGPPLARVRPRTIPEGPARLSGRAPEATKARRDPEEAVDQVWSRWSEWGPNLGIVAVAIG